MKFTKLLVLGALLLAGGTAQAAVDADGKLLKPEPKTQGFKVGTQSEYYYLYNTQAKAFFTEGNSWGTQASVGAAGLKVYFEQKTTDEATYYIFNDYSLAKKAWKVVFFDSNTSMFVDRGSQANYGWAVHENGGTFRLSMASSASGVNPTLNIEAYPDQYVGLDVTTSATNTALSPLLAEGEGHYIDWAIVTEGDIAIYNELLTLYDRINEGEAAGYDMSAEKAVFNDTNATLEQVKAAVVSAGQKALQGASGKTPKDASGYLVNPTFDTIGDFHGWSGTAFGAGGTTSTNAEWYQPAKGADAYQDVTGLAPGWYIAGAKGFYRAGSSTVAYTHFKAQDAQSKAVQFYAKTADQTAETDVVSPYQGAPTSSQTEGEANSGKDEETGLTYYIPNTMKCAEYYMHTLGLYDNFVTVKVGADGTLRIGVKKSGEALTSDWAIFDDFSLTYVGENENDLWAGMAWKKLNNYATFNAEGIVVTKDILDAYLAIKNNDDERAAITNQAEMEAFLAKVDAAKAVVEENIALWKEFKNQVETGMATYNKVAMIDDEAVAYLGAYLVGSEQDLADYIDMGWTNGNAVVILKNVALNNEQLREEIARLSALIADAKTVILPDTDVTDLLQNPDFSKNKEGWTGWGSATSGGNKGGHPTTGGSPNVCAEAYDANGFDLYQVVDGLGIGVYEVSVQGFTRIGRNDGSPHGAAWSNYVSTQGQAKMPVYIYLNDNTTNIKDCHDEPQTKDFYSDTSIANFIDATTGMLNNNVDSVVNDGYYPNLPEQIFVPNTMTGAGYAFQKGIYVNSAFGAVINKGDSLRLGIKGNTNGANWSIYDNFKLHFWGKQADKVLLALNSAIDDVENNQLKKNMTTDARAAINEALAAAKTSAQTEQADGDAMFEKLAALYKAKALIIDAEQLLNDLEAAKDSLLTEWQNLTGNGATYPTLLTEARDLANEVNRKLQTSNISKDEIDAYIVSLRAYKANVAVYAALVTAADKLDTAIGDLNYDYETMASSDEWVALKEEMTLVNDIKTRLADTEDADAKLPVEEAKTLTEKLNEYQKNVTKYADLQKALQELEDAIGNAEAEGITVPNEVNIQFAEITADFADGLIALEEIDAKIQLVRELITKINAPANIDLASDENPVDLTAMIKNPGFEKDGENATAGWLGLDGSGVSGGGDTQKYAYALEYYEKTFDLHQVLYGMPAGVYEVKAKGFYRFGSVENDYNIWWKEEKRDTANAFLYGMSLADSVRSSVPLKLISAGAVREQLKPAEGEELNENFINADGYIQGQSKYGVAENDTVYMPGSMLSAKYWFMHNDCYNNSVFFRLNEKGNLSIGVKENVSIGQNWVILDDFELWYYGANSAKQPAGDPSGISSVANGDIVRSEYFNINGMRTIAPQKGIVIVRQTLSDGNVVVKKMNLK